MRNTQSVYILHSTIASLFCHWQQTCICVVFTLFKLCVVLDCVVAVLCSCYYLWHIGQLLESHFILKKIWPCSHVLIIQCSRVHVFSVFEQNKMNERIMNE